ncbi:DUF4185 domain-containing protein [Microbacterium alcoholitolerans]|uniref:DUF4185 domain-containing protein n=1 Tax=unclassified Microbacterium TaxID=2609290 RepID=UPI003D168682
MISSTAKSSRGRSRSRTAAAIGALLAITGLSSGGSVANAADPEPLPPSPAVMIAQMTGSSATTDTAAAWRVTGTDLGIMWDNGRGEVLTAFGDTFGDWSGPGGGGGDWRSNVLLRSTDTDLSDGMSFDSAVEDVPGHAGELIPSKKIPGDEHTTIPTAGIAVGDRQYMAFMSVKEWGPPGQWATNFSRIAYSDDNGETWNSTDGPTWQNTATGSTWEGGENQHPFQMVAFEKRDGYVYMFGTPNGRLGAAHVARVAEDEMLDKDAWRYWDGAAWAPGDGSGAAEIVPPMNSELSVQYNEHTGKWLMVTLDGKADGTMLLRTADSPQGPWSEGESVANSLDYPGLYGGYIHPWSTGNDLYIALSQWDPYNVFLIRVQLDEDGTLINPNLIRNSSFERSEAMTEPWACNGNCGIDTNHTWAYAGSRQAWMRNSTGNIDVHQQVPVEPNTDYVFSGFVVTGGAAAQGEFGVREIGPGAKVLGSEAFEQVVPYERLEITFNSGASTTIEAFVGTALDGDRWVQIDDLAIVKADPTATPGPGPTDPDPEPEPDPDPEPTAPAPQPSEDPGPDESPAPVAPAPDDDSDATVDGGSLAATGADGAALVLPIALGALLLLAGGAFLLIRRRHGDA